MKKAFVLSLLVLLLAGCGRGDPDFLPVAAAVTNDMVLLAGYAPGDETPQYEVRTVPADSVGDLLFHGSHSAGTLRALVLTTEQARENLYALYAPFLFSDTAPEGMKLVLCDDPAALFSAEERTDLDDPLFPSLISVDIACRTPREYALIPHVGTDGLLRDTAVFDGETLLGFLSQEELPYVLLLRGEKTDLELPFTLSDGTSGTLHSTWQMQKTGTDSIDLTGEGYIISMDAPDAADPAILQEEIQKAVCTDMLHVIAALRSRFSVDIFGFSDEVRCTAYLSLQDPSQIRTLRSHLFCCK